MNNKRGRLIRVSEVGALLGTLVFASSAVADSMVTYSGIQCTSSSLSTNTGTYASPLKGYDPGNAGSVIRCPLTRIASDAAGDITGIYVRVHENSSSTSLKCRAISCDGTASSCDEGTEGESGVAFTGTTFFSLGSVDSFSNGFAFIVCTAPSSMGVYTIYSYRASD